MSGSTESGSPKKEQGEQKNDPSDSKRSVSKARARARTGANIFVGALAVFTVFAVMMGIDDDHKNTVHAETLRLACEGGGEEACFNLGNMYAVGQGWPKPSFLGVTQDLGRAVQFFRQGCEGGHAEACTNLGAMYLVGAGVTQDLGRAAQLNRQACEGGYAPACTNLGVMYTVGQGVPQDHALAAQLYRQACEGGYAKACANLGLSYRDGQGVPQANARAVQLFRQACEGDEVRACNHLGDMYLEGQGVRKDFARAEQLYRQACERGYAQACFNRGSLYLFGAGVTQDRALAEQLYRQACEGGYGMHVCDGLGIAYEKNKKTLPGQNSIAKALSGESIASSEPRSTQTVREFPYYALVSCGFRGDHTRVQACFAGQIDTELELRNGNQYGLYKFYEITRLGSETREGLRIDLRENFQLKAQNSDKTLVLTVTIFESATKRKVFEKSAGQFGVISVEN